MLAAFAHPDHLLLVGSRDLAYLLPSSNLKCFGYSYESIYLHIWANKQAGGDLYMHLRRQGKKYDKRRNGKSTRGQIKNRVSIDDSPEIVDDKSRIGDWEIDTVIGKGHSGALVTIVELVTKYTVSVQANSKSAADVTKATISLLNPFKGIVHTITADNGKEFSYHERISQALSAEVYFAHPTTPGREGYTRRLSICYVVGCARSPRSPTTRRLMGLRLLAA
ncbi:MAG: IS30 family transposase [Candidatus Endonucleobacter sp. (ex Gigantidas childressi)]|nr:IS30 family transposase [Candidatus Endonucleobacter sp. (ex Gigantidas childressi)]